MRKVLIALTALILASTSAAAQYRGHHVGHYGGHYGGHHGGHRGGYGAAPWIAGALSLGVLGAIWYDQYGRHCWRKVVEYDNFGNPVVRTFCD